MEKQKSPTALHIQSPSPYTLYIDPAAALTDLFPFSNHSMGLVLMDENTRRDCWPDFQQRLPVGFPVHTLTLPPGESHKHLDTCRQVWDEWLKVKADRHALVINLGGGVIGDLGGFCARSYLRGISFIQVPTTLLAMVDASVGGKLGVNFGGIKNSLGTFANPQAVFLFSHYLETLSPKEVRSGFAECLKHALIEGGTLWQVFSSFDQIPDVPQLGELLPALIAVKQKVVETDPLERGHRKVLNLGHTLGHALESLLLSTHTPLTHGEAIAIGILCENWISREMGSLPEVEWQQIQQTILRFFPDLFLPDLETSALIEKLFRDKKNRDGQIRFSLLHSIGQIQIDVPCPVEYALKSLSYYRQLQN